MLSLAWAKSRSLELANDAKTGKQSIFREIYIIMSLERHKEPYLARYLSTFRSRIRSLICAEMWH